MINKQSIIDELDRLYKFETNKYITECTDLKRMGFKIYRNSDGEHKIVEPRSSSYNQPLNIYEAYGGIFNEIFGGGKQ